MSEETTALLPEEPQALEAEDLPPEVEAIEAEAEETPGPVPETWPPQARMIDGFLEILAYTRFLLNGGPVKPVAYAEAAAHFQTLLDRAESFRGTHGFPEEAWREALFAVCAWVDEQVLCSAWEGGLPWAADQLQRRLFGTTRAGEAFFERLEALPEDADQVLEVYDYCLSLGFQGRYFTPADQEALHKLRADLGERLPLALRSGAEPQLFPAAGQTLPGELSHRHLPYRYLVYLLLAAIPPAVFLLFYASFHAFLDHLVRPLLP